MTIHLYTLCWNEMDVLPFVVDYWKRIPVTKAIVYDNGSTDGSIEYLKQFDWIEVRNFTTEGKRNAVQRDIKNTKWKESIGVADFVIVCDIDECLYLRSNDEFQKMKANGYTICAPKWYDFISEDIPQYTEGKLLHEVSNKAVKGNGKVVIFNPNKINEINYTVGSHTCDPRGTVKYYDGDIYLLHINHHLSLEYLLSRYQVFNERLSAEDKSKKWGIHYGFSEEKLRRDYSEGLKNAVNFNDLVKN